MTVLLTTFRVAPLYTADCPACHTPNALGTSHLHNGVAHCERCHSDFDIIDCEEPNKMQEIDNDL